jgi:mannosyltransferase
MNINLEKSRSFPKDWLGLVIVISAALLSRFWMLINLKSLDFDEMISFSVAEKPLAQIWSYVKWEMHPPLHYYFLHFWFWLFGETEISAHLSSVFLSVLAVVAIYYLGKELFQSRAAAFFAAILCALSPLFCFFGVWARMYSLLFLTATLSFLFFFKFIKSKGKKIFFGERSLFFLPSPLCTRT